MNSNQINQALTLKDLNLEISYPLTILYKITPMKIRFFILLLFPLSCMPVRIVDYQKQSETDLKQYKTYTYYTIEEPENKRPFFEENVAILQKAIDKEMAKLNYSRVESGGDLLINIGYSVEEKVQTRETDFRTDGMQYMGQRNYHWESEEVVVDRYKEGTIALDFIDMKKKELVWNGTVAGTITDNRKKIEARINTAIENLFKKFPR